MFIPYARSRNVDPSKPIILTIDGHDSHECLEIKRAVYESRGDATVIVFAFLSKFTHKVQPLDVGIFNHTQRAWKKICDDLVAKNKPMSRYSVIPEYMRMQKEFLTPRLLQSSFRATGIYPLNANIFTKEDFAPSQTFSISAHVPESYPPEIPSSDPAIPSDYEHTDHSRSPDSDSDMDSDSNDSDYQDLNNSSLADLDFNEIMDDANNSESSLGANILSKEAQEEIVDMELDLDGFLSQNPMTSTSQTTVFFTFAFGGH